MIAKAIQLPIMNKPRAQIKDFQDSRIKEIAFFLMDPNVTKLHETKFNDESVDIVLNFLRNKNK